MPILQKWENWSSQVSVSRMNEWVNKSKWSSCYSSWIQFSKSLYPVSVGSLGGHIYTPLLPKCPNTLAECHQRQCISVKGRSPHPVSYFYIALKPAEPASHTELPSKRWNSPSVSLGEVCWGGEPTDDFGLHSSFALMSRGLQHPR